MEEELRKKIEKIEDMKPNDLKKMLISYENERWLKKRGKKIECGINEKSKYNDYYDQIKTFQKKETQEEENTEEEGIGTDELEEPFYSFGLAFSRKEIRALIDSVDDDGSGKIEFPEFLRIVNPESKSKIEGNKKITEFFKKLTENKLGDGKYIESFGLNTIMNMERRTKLLNAFQGNSKDKIEGLKVLQAYSKMLNKKKEKNEKQKNKEKTSES